MTSYISDPMRQFVVVWDYGKLFILWSFDSPETCFYFPMSFCAVIQITHCTLLASITSTSELQPRANEKSSPNIKISTFVSSRAGDTVMSIFDRKKSLRVSEMQFCGQFLQSFWVCSDVQAWCVLVSLNAFDTTSLNVVPVSNSNLQSVWSGFCFNRYIKDVHCGSSLQEKKL